MMSRSYTYADDIPEILPAVIWKTALTCVEAYERITGRRVRAAAAGAAGASARAGGACGVPRVMRWPDIRDRRGLVAEPGRDLMHQDVLGY